MQKQVANRCLLFLVASACAPLGLQPEPAAVVTESWPVSGMAVAQSVQVRIEATFDFMASNFSTFTQQIVDALNSHDFELVRQLVDDSLIITLWRSQGAAYAAEEAIEQVQSNYSEHQQVQPARSILRAGCLESMFS